MIHILKNSEMKNNNIVAVVGLRLVLGLIFFMQGYGKVFSIGVQNLVQADFFYETYKNLLPFWLIEFTAYYTSYIELIGGFLLIIGFKTNVALYVLLSVLVIVTFGHGLVEPVWDLSHVIYRLLLLIILLLIPREWDKFSIDYFINYRNIKSKH
jgi:putative oxidoreductase